MKKLIPILLITLASLTAAQPNQINDLENEHYQIKIVSDYPTQGSMEAHTRVGESEKREIVLRNDVGADLKSRCNTLYGASITSNPNPCYLLN